ncbi:MAG TPA: SDR family oxidoreductase [Solirubrobacterales bacterium]|jgi:uncharacterized protein YbjT (DUF2867 family)|nr:SDR family oxidoreductase [Solirubrobacterales bacterium]
MDVVIVGGHGKIALRLAKLLADRGDRVRGLIRNRAHAADLEEQGAEPVLCDVEATEDISEHVAGADTVVFAAGAGPGSGPERKRTVDYGAAAKLIEACQATGVRRYLMISAMSVDRPDRWSEQMRPYFEAKRDADEALVAAGLDHTIVRPGGLTDRPDTGLVEVGMPLDHSGQIPRDDVAATLLACLDEPGMVGLTFDLIGGETPIAEAIASLAAGRS